MERANTRPSTIKITSDGQEPYSVVTQGHVGDIQYISDLNHFHTRRTPGEFHAYPVTIWKSHSTTTDGRTNKATYGSYKNTILQGDVLGYFAYQAGYDPRSLVQYQTNWDQTMSTVAQNRAFAAAAAPAFDVGVQLGELKETLSGFAQPLQALRKFIRDYNKLFKTRVPGVSIANPQKAGGSASGLDMLTGSWLEWRYGIRPVIQTLEDLIKHVQEQSYSWSGKMLRKTGKFKRQTTYRTRATGWPYLFSVTCSCAVDIETRYYAKLYYTEDAPLSFEQRYGIDLSNALPVAWEIVPMSFIVDRIWKIGDWIQAMKFYTHPRTTKGMVVSKKTTMTGSALCENVTLFGVKETSFEQNPEHFLKIEHLERRVFQTPVVSITPPVALSHHSLSMLLDEITLTWQRLPKMKRR